MTSPAQISALHAAYVHDSGQAVALNMARERAWFEWLRSGNGAWTVEDLRLVIAEIRAGIRLGKRNAGALRFSNLIERPDLFEEELALARQARRVAARAPRIEPGKAAVLAATGRTPGAPPKDAVPVSQVIAAMRAAVDNAQSDAPKKT